jgi:hypothetical protein
MIKVLGNVYQNAEVAITPLDEAEDFNLHIVAKSAVKNPILVDMFLMYGDNIYVTPNRYVCSHVRNVIRQFGLGRISKLSERDKYFKINEEDGIKSLVCKLFQNSNCKDIYINQWAAQSMTLRWDQALFGYSITYVFTVQKRLKVFSTSREWMEKQWWSSDRGIIKDEVDIPILPKAVEESLNKVVNAEILIEG